MKLKTLEGVPVTGTPFTITVISRPEEEHVGARCAFEIHEGLTYGNAPHEPRATLTVDLWFPEPGAERYGLPYNEPEISWPSTSDKRPALAIALAAALTLAATRAKYGPVV